MQNQFPLLNQVQRFMMQIIGLFFALHSNKKHTGLKTRKIFRENTLLVFADKFTFLYKKFERGSKAGNVNFSLWH